MPSNKDFPLGIIEALEPLFEKIIKHALHGRSRVIDAEAKKRLREALIQKNKIRLRRENKKRP